MDAYAPRADLPAAAEARAMIEANNHGSLRFLRAMTPLLRDHVRLVIVASAFGTLESLPMSLRPRFDTTAHGPDEIDATMNAYVAAAEAGTAAREGWPAWVNIPSKVGQVAVTRAFARQYAGDPARPDDVLINAVCPPERRSAAIGLWGGIMGLAVAAGPVVGGAVVAGLDWHWIFWLNVPIGLVLIPLSASRLTESVGLRPRIDLPGVALAAAGTLGLTWALVRANSAGWGAGEVLGTLLGGVLLIGLFLAWERRAAFPVLPLGLFRRRGFAAANAVGFFVLAGLFGALSLMMQFFQNALGYDPLQAGLRILPWTATHPSHRARSSGCSRQGRHGLG